MSKITVTVQLGRFPGMEETVCIDVDDYIVDEICTPLKVSDSMLGPLFDTPAHVVHHVRRMRNNTASGLARDMTKALLAAFEKRDTFNGYTRAENKAFYEGSDQRVPDVPRILLESDSAHPVNTFSPPSSGGSSNTGA